MEILKSSTTYSGATLMLLGDPDEQAHPVVNAVRNFPNQPFTVWNSQPLRNVGFNQYGRERGINITPSGANFGLDWRTHDIGRGS